MACRPPRDTFLAYKNCEDTGQIPEGRTLGGPGTDEGFGIAPGGQPPQRQPPGRQPSPGQPPGGLPWRDDAQGNYVAAEPLFKRSRAIQEKVLGPEHPNVAQVLENYAVLLRKTNRNAEAAKMEARAKAILAKHAQANPKK